MLARVGSGASGIAEYLETGRKKGREFDRDLIDERITLEGDLDLTSAIIDGIETAQEGDAKYLHITLGFSEDFTSAEDCSDAEVNLEKMKNVVAAYREMLMTAYDPSEYAFYAEAHIPKVTHEINESTGEFNKRLPHIHIVIPMRNLESDRYLNPFGFGKATIEYAEAIQEKINRDFKLRSPKTSMRLDTKTVHPLAKHNDSFKTLNAKQIREAVLDIVKNGEARTFDEFVKAAEVFGEVKVRHGKEGDYINIKPGWADKGINVKDVTSRSFDVDVEAIGSSDTALKNYDDLVSSWITKGSLEARYVTSGNRDAYKLLDEQEKISLLELKRKETSNRLTPKQEHVNERPDYDTAEFDRKRQQRQQVAVSLYQSNLAKIRREGTPATITSLRNLSSIPLVHDRKHSKMLLQSNALNSLGSAGTTGSNMRWKRIIDLGNVGKGFKRFRERTLTPVQTLKKLERPEELSSDKLKNETSPSIVLSDAARRFGINIEDYTISSAKDGTPRIRHQDKHFNLGDFYTKHLNIPWSQAQAILKDCYHDTLSNGLPAPDKELWKSFSTWRERDYLQAQERKATKRANLRKQLVKIRDEYKALKMNIKKYKAEERQAILAKGRAEQIIKTAQILELEREANEEAKRPSRNTQYRQFLNDLASEGNLHALGELRRSAPLENETGDTITGEKSKTVLPLPSYKIDYTGKVTYYKDEDALVTDSVKGVSVIDAQTNAYDIALKVAVARYGKDLTFNGDALFMKNMTAAARKSGMDLIIRDADRPRAAPIVIERVEKPFIKK